MSSYFSCVCTVLYFTMQTFMILNFYFFIALFGYASFSALLTNTTDGWACFLGFTAQEEHDDMYVNCSESMGVVLGYVICNAAVVVSMSTLLQLGHQLLGRATEAAILFAFVVLWAYDVHVNRSLMFGGNGGIIDILAIVVLIAGMEVYDRDPEPDVEVITKHTDSPSGCSMTASNSSSNLSPPV